MTGDWRDFRPAIWLAMLGIAVFALINPPYIGVAVLGAAIGVGVRIERRRRRLSGRPGGQARTGGGPGTGGPPRTGGRPRAGGRTRTGGRGRNQKR
jgi:hypothetical protein